MVVFMQSCNHAIMQSCKVVDKLGRGDTEKLGMPTRYVTTVQERKAEVIRQIKELKDNDFNGSNIQSSNLSAFLGNRDVREYFAVLTENLFSNNKSDKVFQSEEEVEEEIVSFLLTCSTASILPTLSGLCCYLGITTPMYNKILSDPTKIGWFSLNKFNEFVKNNLDVAMANNKISSTFYSLYMSHYFGVNQSANINMNTTLKTTVNTTTTLNLIKNQLALEEQEMTLEQPKDNS